MTPRTKAGRALLERESLNARAFSLIRPEDIIAIEDEALSDRAVPLQEAASFLPLREIQRLRAIEEWARHLVALGNQPGLDDEEWEAAFTSLEKATRGEGR